MDLNLITFLLVGIVLVLSAIYLKLTAIFTQIKKNQEINNSYNEDHYRQRSEALQLQTDRLEELCENLEQLQNEVHEIRTVADIFYKYKLPDRNERKLLDQIAIDNEVSQRSFGSGGEHS